MLRAEIAIKNVLLLDFWVTVYIHRLRRGHFLTVLPLIKIFKLDMNVTTMCCSLITVPYLSLVCHSM